VVSPEFGRGDGGGGEMVSMGLLLHRYYHLHKEKTVALEEELKRKKVLRRENKKPGRTKKLFHT